MMFRVKDTPRAWIVKCPAIGFMEIPKNGKWAFNGDYERPTFSPSMNMTWGKEGQSMPDFKADPHPNRSHVFIRNGFIEYLSDCTHTYAGRTVEIEPLSETEARMCYGDKAL